MNLFFSAKLSIQTEATRFLNKQLEDQIVVADSESDTAKDQSTGKGNLCGLLNS
jgi:hypothetical protein